MTERLIVGSIASWYGSNRMLAKEVGKELEGLPFVAIPFAGGLSEVPFIGARTLLINDLHRHVMNLASILADRELGPILVRRLKRKCFHPDELTKAQVRCGERQWNFDKSPVMFGEHSEYSESDESPVGSDLDWAEDYFVSAWMTRHGSAGTPAEFTGGISTRWSASGGDSAAHYWSAVKSLVAWRRLLQRANFTTLDVFDFMARVKDLTGVGIYCDQPFPGPGDKYTHTFGEDKTRRLAKRLAEFQQTRVVCRFYVHSLVKECYPQTIWRWRELKGRKQTNDDAPEVLICNFS